MHELLPHSGVVNGEAFARGLERILNTVVLVHVETGNAQTNCTGWMVTPRLVLLPAYAFGTGVNGSFNSAQVSLHRNGILVWTDMADMSFGAENLKAHASSDTGSHMDLAVLRLMHEHPVTPQVFRSRPLEPAELVIVAHRSHLNGGAESAALSFGRLLPSPSAESMCYHCSSGAGSGGAPVYDVAWQFLGMHLLTHSPEASSGPSQLLVMEMLQRSRWWKEIAHYQELADVVAAFHSPIIDDSSERRAAPKPALIRAALSFKVRPELLTQSERDELADYVVDKRAHVWTMKTAARRNILRGAGPLRALLYLLPGDPDSPEQRVVAAILRGPPYSLIDATEDDLGRWLQAVRWFGAVVPDLPTPARVNQLLQRRRIRGRLADISGGDFIGRKREIRRMRSWFDSESEAPLCVSGVGGVGKSALVAHFVESLPESVVLLWLDFDRATLAPDDAASVVAALLEQAVPQLTEGDAAPTPDPREDLEGARARLVQLLAAPALNRRTLVVLDSFEAAQYSERYQELWPELDKIAGMAGKLQVIVAGRVPLPTLQFRGKTVEDIPLRGLSTEDAREWLGRHGVPDVRIQEEVVRVSGGLPLVLKLAERLMQAGGELADLPENLPDEMIAGVLYDRILDRIYNPDFKEVAKGAVVLRRFTAEMVHPLFGGLLELPSGEPVSWFREFAREAALVEGQDELRLRPEVRAAALALLERQDANLVFQIDSRAVKWYERQNANDPIVAAELVYHCLRVGDVKGAVRAWRDGCAVHLQFAEETLHGEARVWLARRLGTSVSVQGADVQVWEAEAADRVKDARSRGKSEHASGIFRERLDRSRGGALAFHEAYERWRHSDHEVALAMLLRHGIDKPDPGSRERAMLAALIYAENGDRREALRILHVWSTPDRWADRREAATECAAVHASRVCLATNLDQESITVGNAARWAQKNIKRVSPADWLVPMDVLQPNVLRRLERSEHTASMFLLPLPNSLAEREQFLDGLKQYRSAMLGNPEPDALRRQRERIFAGDLPGPRFGQSMINSSLSLLTASWLRWAVLADGALVNVLKQALRSSALNPVEESIVRVLALFAGVPNLQLQMPHKMTLEEALEHIEPRLSYSRTLEMHQGEFAPALMLRQRALPWCRGNPKPLQQLIERFARGDEQS